MGLSYLRTTTGILKIIQLVFNMVAFICVAVQTGSSGRGEAFLVASVGAFVITLLIVIIRVTGLDKVISLPWNKVEFFYCVIWSIFYLITSALVIDTGVPTYVAGGVFGLFALVVYLIDAYDKYVTSPV